MTNLPVGTILYSMLDEKTFQIELGAGETWVLADGRSVAGQNTRYENVTRSSRLPNLLGVFVRGKNNGRKDGYENPDGEMPLGHVTKDRFRSHNHSGSTGADSPDHSHGFGGYRYGVSYGSDNAGFNIEVPPNGFYRQTDGASARHTHVINADGEKETAPTSITLNPFVRIN
jgi:hypothetical protein